MERAEGASAISDAPVAGVYVSIAGHDVFRSRSLVSFATPSASALHRPSLEKLRPSLRSLVH